MSATDSSTPAGLVDLASVRIGALPWSRTTNSSPRKETSSSPVGASSFPLEVVIEKISALNATARSLGCQLPAPFMSLSFLSFSPIPALKLTDQGLVDAVAMKLTSLFEE